MKLFTHLRNLTAVAGILSLAACAGVPGQNAAADKTAADLDIPDGARMRLPAGAVLVAVDQRVEISHGGSSFCMVSAPKAHSQAPLPGELARRSRD